MGERDRKNSYEEVCVRLFINGFVEGVFNGDEDECSKSHCLKLRNIIA